MRRRHSYGLGMAPNPYLGLTVVRGGGVTPSFAVVVDALGLLILAAFSTTATHLVVNITAPAGYVGTYLAPLSSLALGPVNIIAPVVTGTIGTGNVATASSGIWVYDIDQGTPTISRQWEYADGSDIAGQTGTTYTQASGDDLLGISIREFAINTQGTGEVVSVFSAAAGNPPYSFLGSNWTDNTTNSQSFSVDVGAAVSGQYFIVGCSVQGSDIVPTVTVGGTALTRLIGTDPAEGIVTMLFGGVVNSISGVQTVTVAWQSAAYEWKTAAVWKVTGLASTTPRSTGISTSGDLSISVLKGVAMFYFQGTILAITGNLSASTQTPAREAAISPTNGYSADWTVSATNPAFNIDQSAISGRGVAVTFA